MAITMSEILMGRSELEKLDKDVQESLRVLLERINVIRAKYSKPMTVNDGFRRPQDIPKNGASRSKHLYGQAIDIDDDANGTLWKWLMKPEQMQLLKDTGLWLESGGYTHYMENGQSKSWVHFQIIPPLSGKRIYIPSLAPNPNPNFWDGKYDAKYDAAA